MKQFFQLLILLIFVISCTEQNKTKQISFAPKVTEAKGYLVPKDSVQQPKTITAGIPITIKAGQPKVTLTNTNIHHAGIPTVIMAGIPRVYTPGKDPFLLPKQYLLKIAPL